MADMPEASQALLVITKVWWQVVAAVNKLLEADGKFGFSKIEANLNPSMADIMHGLTVFEFVITLMMDSEFLDHDETRMALNSKQCVLLIRRMSEALKSKDQDEYDEVIRLLALQPKI